MGGLLEEYVYPGDISMFVASMTNVRYMQL